MLDRVSKFFRRHSFRGSSDVSHPDPVQTISFKHRRSFSKSSDDGYEPAEVNTSSHHHSHHHHHHYRKDDGQLHRRRESGEGPPISRSACGGSYQSSNRRNSFCSPSSKKWGTGSGKQQHQESPECSQPYLVSSVDQPQPVYENLQIAGYAKPVWSERVKHDHKNSRPERKLTKDSGYETSPQNDSDYVNCDWVNKTKALNNKAPTGPLKAEMIASDGTELTDGAAELRARSAQLGYSRVNDSSSSPSNAFIPSQSSRFSSSDSITSQANNSGNDPLVNCWMNANSTKSTPSLHRDLECGNQQKPLEKTPASLSLSTCRSTPNLDLETSSQKSSMVAKKFKKASIYEVLASKSGLDFAPMIQCHPNWEKLHDHSAEELSSHIRQASNQSSGSDWASSGYHSMSIHSKQSSYSAEEDTHLSFAHHRCSSKDDISEFDIAMNSAPPPPHEYFYRDLNASSCLDCNSAMPSPPALPGRGYSSLVIPSSGRYDEIPHVAPSSSIYSSRMGECSISSANVQNLAAHFQANIRDPLPHRNNVYPQKYAYKKNENFKQRGFKESPSWSRPGNCSKSSDADVKGTMDSHSNSSTPLLDRLKLESRSDMCLGTELHQRHNSVDSGAGSEGSCHSSQETLKWHGSNSDLTFCVVSSKPATSSGNSEKQAQYTVKHQNANKWVPNSKRNSTSTVCSSQSADLGPDPYSSKCEPLPALQADIAATNAPTNQILNATQSVQSSHGGRYIINQNSNKNSRYVQSPKKKAVVPYQNCNSYSQSKNYAGPKIDCGTAEKPQLGYALPTSASSYLENVRRSSGGKFSNPRSPPPSQLVGNTLVVKPSYSGESSPDNQTYENLSFLSTSNSSLYSSKPGFTQGGYPQPIQSSVGHRGSYAASSVLGSHSVVHSSRVMQPQRHNSQSVMYYKSNSKHSEQSGRKSSVSSLPCEFEPKPSANNSRPSDHALPNSSSSGLSSPSSPSCENPLNASRLSYLDGASKKSRYPDPQLKAIQKQAVLSYYERVHTNNIPPTSKLDDKSLNHRVDDTASPSSSTSSHLASPQRKANLDKAECEEKLWSLKSTNNHVPVYSIAPSSSSENTGSQSAPVTSTYSQSSLQSSSPHQDYENTKFDFANPFSANESASAHSKKCDTPSPPSAKHLSNDEWSRCSSPDLPLPPPPKTVLTELIENNDPLPPPPQPASKVQCTTVRKETVSPMQKTSSSVTQTVAVSTQMQSTDATEKAQEVSEEAPNQRCSPKPQENSTNGRMVHFYNPADSPPPPLPRRNYRKLSPLPSLSSSNSNNNGNKIVVSIRPQQRDQSQTSQTTEDSGDDLKNLSNKMMDMSTQTTNSLSRKDLNTPKFIRRKKLAEMECHMLSQDLVKHIDDENLSKILIPALKRKTTADYIEDLFGEKVDEEALTEKALKILDSADLAKQLKTNLINAEKPLPADSAYFTTSESKAKFLTRYNEDIMQEKNKACVDEEASLTKKKELIVSLTRKLDILKSEQVAIQEEIGCNSELGKEVTAKVKSLAESHEFQKFSLHVDEVGKIIKLLLSLSGRLARAENALTVLPKDARPEEMESLRMKRDKLSSQYEEAKHLKECIDKRSQKISKFLKNYLSEEQYKDYEHFTKMNSKLAVDARDIDDKIKLGEEQLCALNKSIEKVS